MGGILWVKLRLLMRNPAPLIVTTIICICLTFFIGKASFSKVDIPVYSSLPTKQALEIVNDLSEDAPFSFSLLSKKEVEEKVMQGKAEVGIKLGEDHFILLIAGETANQAVIERYVAHYYGSKHRDQVMLDRAIATGTEEEVRRELKNAKENPLLTIVPTNYSPNNEMNQGLHVLFGYSLFFAVFTIGTNVAPLLSDRKNGIWSRLLLSPISKTKNYLSMLLFSFLLGYVQIVLIFSVFKWGMDISFNGSFGKALLVVIPYVLTIVAISLLVASLTKTVAQFNAFIPLLGVSMAMLGGAFWPMEVVTSNAIIAISKLDPITYGMELLTGAVVSNEPLSELLYPVAVLLTISLVSIIVGIQLMERKHN